MNKNKLLKIIVKEELSKYFDDKEINGSNKDGTIALSLKKGELPLPSDVKPIMPKGEYPNFDYDCSQLERHIEFPPADITTKFKDVDNLTMVLGERFSLKYKQKFFKHLHEVKNDIKNLRENKNSISSIKHLILSEYIEIINEHIDLISYFENKIKENMSENKKIEVSKLLEKKSKSLKEACEKCKDSSNKNELKELSESLDNWLLILKNIDSKTEFTVD